MKKTLIQISRHAKLRMLQRKIPEEEIVTAFENSRRMKVPSGRRIYKNVKYGNDQDNIDYFGFKDWLFVVREIKEGEYYLITVSKNKDVGKTKFYKN